VEKLGVEIQLGVMVTDIDGEGVSYKRGEQVGKLPAKTVLWAGGIIATAFAKRLAERTKSETDKLGRITVNPDLTVPNYPDIYITGDLAHFTEENGQALPGVAQVAIQGGTYAAKALRARLLGKRGIAPFHYFNKGDMAVIGRNAAVANIFGWHISGFVAWFIWLFVHLIYIVEFQSRVKVFIQWGIQYLTFSRGARLITGVAATDVLEAPSGALTHHERKPEAASKASRAV
jgi:NADH:ubiquinone reductase (H+-translocating)